MREEYGYPDGEELEALIAEVEESGMIAPPVYLKDQIMNAVSEEKREKRKRTARIHLLLYSAKIVGAAAVAIFCLMAIPTEVNQVMAAPENSVLEKQIDKDVERYKEEKRKLLEEPAEKKIDLGGFINGISSWFETEERNDD